MNHPRASEIVALLSAFVLGIVCGAMARGGERMKTATIEGVQIYWAGKSYLEWNTGEPAKVMLVEGRLQLERTDEAKRLDPYGTAVSLNHVLPERSKVITFGTGRDFGRKFPEIIMSGESLVWSDDDGWYHFRGEERDGKPVRALVSNFGGKWVLAGADQIDIKTGLQWERRGPGKWEKNGKQFKKVTKDDREQWEEIR